MSIKHFALAARFQKPEQLLAVSKDLRDRQVDKWEANLPYPLHGLDEAMGKGPSKVGWVTFLIFATVINLVFAFVYWTSVHDYPLNIGGKPFFAFFAWVPVLFELSVITSAVGTLVLTILLFWRLPLFKHNIAETEYLKACVSDQFGVYVEVDSKNFNETELRQIFDKHAAHVIEWLDVVESEPLRLPMIGQWREIYFWLTLPVVAVLVVVGSYFTLNKVLYDQIPFIHTPVAGQTLFDKTGWTSLKSGPFNWMDRQDKEKSLGRSGFFSDGAAMRPHVEGTVARNFLPQADLQNIVNPVPLTEASLRDGKKLFGVYCSACHGGFGDGDGEVSKKGMTSPSLHSEKLHNATDGTIYSIITNGQNNNMPALDKQISRDDRWKIVQYVRALQRAKNAKDTDLP